MASTTRSDQDGAGSEIAAALAGINPESIDQLAGVLAGARRVLLFGGGREGLALRGWTMRLFHAGVAASYVGDVTCPPAGAGDVVVLSSGPGAGEVTWALLRLAKLHGAEVVLTTAVADSDMARAADHVFLIPAQTMADDLGSTRVLPMGTAFEVALFAVGDLIVRQIRDARGETAESMRSRHANLE